MTAPTATAPMYWGPGRCPITAVSTMPRSGTETLERMIGPARRQMRPCQSPPFASIIWGVSDKGGQALWRPWRLCQSSMESGGNSAK